MTTNDERLAALPGVRIKLEDGSILKVYTPCRTHAQCDVIAAKYPDGVIPIEVLTAPLDSDLSTASERVWLAARVKQLRGEFGSLSQPHTDPIPGPSPPIRVMPEIISAGPIKRVAHRT